MFFFKIISGHFPPGGEGRKVGGLRVRPILNGNALLSAPFHIFVPEKVPLSHPRIIHHREPPRVTLRILFQSVN